MKQLKIIVEQHPGGDVSYPLGLKGVVGKGDTYEEVLADVKSAIKFPLEALEKTSLRRRRSRRCSS